MASGNSRDTGPGKRLNLLAAAWGAAEATLFFIVPDVLLSRIALQNRRQALVACSWTLGGALIGGLAVWLIGYVDPEPTRAIFAQIPAISPAMIDRVHQQILDLGPWAVFVGPLTGTPYKLYALEAASAGFGLAGFMLVSVPARLLRFVIVVLVTNAVAIGLRRFASIRTLQILHLAAWLTFYGWYFTVMG